MADAYKDMFSDKVFQDLINFHPFTIDDFLAF